MKNKTFIYSLLFLIALLIGAIGVGVFFPDSNWHTDVQIAMQGPSFAHLFGTDSLGRDLLLRVLQGAHATIFTGLFCGVLSLVIGVIYGGLSAWRGGWYDQLLMRALEIFVSLPHLMTIGLLVIFLSKGSGGSEISGIFKLSLAISLGSWMSFARLTRNLVLKEKTLPYVEAAVAMGSPPLRLFCKEIFPNLFPTLLIMFGLQIPNFLLFEGLLSFMGLGLQPPTSSWGILLQEGWKSMSTFPHMLLAPALVLFLTIFSLNVVFEQLRRKLLRTLDPVDTHQ